MHRPPHICMFKISKYWVFSKQCRPGGMLKMTVISCALENLLSLVVYWITLISRSLSQTKHSKTIWGRNGSPGSVPDLSRWRWYNQETACVRTYIMCIGSLEIKQQSGEQNTFSQPWRRHLLQSAGYAGGSPHRHWKHWSHTEAERISWSACTFLWLTPKGSYDLWMLMLSLRAPKNFQSIENKPTLV